MIALLLALAIAAWLYPDARPFIVMGVGLAVLGRGVLLGSSAWLWSGVLLAVTALVDLVDPAG